MPNSETIIYANARFIPLHYTNEKWNTSNPVLLDGEYGFVDDAADANHWIKKGDGVKHWNELDYILFNNADISNKQDKTDNSLETSDKTIVGAINELQSGKGTYSKPGSGIPKSDLSSNVQTSLDKADTALQQHQDISGKADKVNVTSADAGKFMRVNEQGEWVAEEVPNANGVNF